MYFSKGKLDGLFCFSMYWELSMVRRCGRLIYNRVIGGILLREGEIFWIPYSWRRDIIGIIILSYFHYYVFKRIRLEMMLFVNKKCWYW